MGLPSPVSTWPWSTTKAPRPVDEDGDLALRIEPERPLGLSRSTGAIRSHGERLSPRLVSHGRLRAVDAEGYFWFAGRADDVINSSAYRIGPFEVENALVEHRAVVEAAVVGKPDAERGEIVKRSWCSPKVHAPSSRSSTNCKSTLSTRPRPTISARIEFVEELPKTVSGKIRRVELRNRR